MSRYLYQIFLAFATVALAQQDNNLVYQIFVRSFADTPTDTTTSGEVGDLKGIAENLDYINDGVRGSGNDLEAGILWLMPIFPSKSYHGYDITDYRGVNPDYGTISDLDALIKAAHRRGVRIILDIAFNHTSNEHPWFQQAIENPSSRFRKFYQFREDDGSPLPGGWHVATSRSGKRIRYFGLFSKSMPDLNFSEPEVHKEITAVAEFWLNRGIDGFRLDAAKHVFGDTFGTIPEADILRNNHWWREFSDFVYKVNPNAVLVGEVLGDAETLRRHAYGLDALLDAPFMHSFRSRIAFPKANVLGQWKDLVNRCREVNSKAHGGFSRNEPFQPFLFLASHDENPRLASFLTEMQNRGMKATVDEAYRVGMYLLLSLGKYPVLYNGDELMQRGVKWNGNPPTDPKNPGDGSRIYDETLREPFPWFRAGFKAPQTRWFVPRFDTDNDGVSVEEENVSGSMLDLVRALSKLRTQHPAFANGEITRIFTDSADWLVFEKDRFLTLINTKGNSTDYNFHQGFHPEYVGAQLLFWSDGRSKTWKNETDRAKHIQSKVLVPASGLVLLRR